MKGVTLKEIAQLAKVSVSTVSLALNNKPGVRPETRAKVVEIARALNYVPNAAARSLANGRAQAIGLVNPISLEQLFSSAEFFMHLSRGLHQAAREKGYNVYLLISETEQETSKMITEIVSQRRVDGLIITNPMEPVVFPSKLHRQRFPCVFVGRPAGFNAVYVDNSNVEIGRVGTAHLLALGHTKIAFVSGPLAFTHCQDRLAGYKLALEEAGIPFDERLVCQAEQKEKTILETLRSWIPTVEFTAVFATSVLHAVCTVAVCRELGFRVPEEIAVVCVEDSSLAKYYSPPITAIELDSFWLGYWAVQLLLRLINGEDPGSPVLLPGRLVVRASSIPYRERR